MHLDTNFLSVPNFGLATGLSYSTIRRQMKRGAIPFFKLGGRLLIPSSFLENLESKGYSPTSEVPLGTSK